jgi:D-methionine transport system substrate-binding protein
MKKTLSIITSVILTLSLAGCANKTNKSTTSNADKKTIVVGATPVPHMEILEQVKPILEKEGYKLDVKKFDNYNIPNQALADGQLDANFFQHVPFLETTIAEKKLDLTYTVKVHVEPMGVYSSKVKSVNELNDKAVIGIPNDPSNGSRALKLLAAQGVIKLQDKDVVSTADITENTKNFEIKPMDPAMLPRSLSQLDAAVINTNFAVQGKLNPNKDAIAMEPKDSPYANILAVRTADKDKPYIQALSKALTSPEIKKFIEEKYSDSGIMPAF